MEKEIKKLEQKFEIIREKIKKQNFHIKSQSGLLDKVMFDSEAVQKYLETKTKEISDLKDELVNEFNGDKSKLEKEIDERTENFIHEMAYLITVGKFKL